VLPTFAFRVAENAARRKWNSPLDHWYNLKVY